MILFLLLLEAVAFVDVGAEVSILLGKTEEEEEAELPIPGPLSRLGAIDTAPPARGSRLLDE